MPASLLGPAGVLVFVHCGEQTELDAVARQDEDDDDDDDDNSEEEECTSEPSAELFTHQPLAYQVTLSNARGIAVEVEIEAEPVPMLRRPCARTERRRRRISASASCDTSRQSVRQIFASRAARPVSSRGSVSRACCAGCRARSTWSFATNRRPTLSIPRAGSSMARRLKKAWRRSSGLDRRIGARSFSPWGSGQRAGAVGSEGNPLQLTIDPKMQQLAREAIETVAQGGVAQHVRKEKKDRTQKSKPKGCWQLRGDQTATLVVVNAEQQDGEIKAVASWPRLARHLHIWDLQALEADGSGTAAIGWRLAIPDQRPGSTFKPITGMTAIDLATARQPSVPKELQERLSALLERADDSSPSRSIFWVWREPDGKERDARLHPAGQQDANSLPVPSADRPRWCARNFGRAGYWQPKPPATTRCGVSSPRVRGDQFGLCEALMVSSNLFFGGISAQIRARTDRSGDSRLALDDMARRLAFDDQPCRDRKGKSRLDKDRKPLPCRSICCATRTVSKRPSSGRIRCAST